MAKQAKNGSGAIKLAVLGATLAGAAAGAYFLFGPKGKANRKHARAWAIKMKGDIVEKLEEAKEVSEPVYHQIIDAVASEYKTGSKAGKEEIETLAKDLKRHWKTLTSSAKKAGKSVAKTAKKIEKKIEAKI